MIIDITQTTKIGRVYRAGSEPLKVEKVTRYSKSGSEYTTTSFSCDVHNMGTHIDVMNPDVVIENERLIGEGIKFDVSHVPNKVIKLKDSEISIEVIKYLVDKNVNIIGIDTLGLGVSKNHGIIDKYLGDHKMYAIENLCNLKDIPNKNFKVYCLPMKIEGLDGDPTRILVEF